MTDQILTDRLHRALTAAADQIPVDAPVNALVPAPAASASTRRAPAGRRTVTMRWLPPAAAVAAVAALLAAGVFFWHQQQKVVTATQVSVSGGVADVGGVRFPIPAGWQVAVANTDSTAVHVCVAADPTPDCDGVQLTIAVPGWFGRTEILPSTAPIFDSCPGGTTVTHMIMTDDHNPIDVAGRPGNHYWGYCSDKPSAVSHLWQLDDLSLQIYSPPGYATQISALVAGLDLSKWAHHQGPQAAFFTTGTTAPPTS